MKKYKEDIKLAESIELALDAVYEATEAKTTAESVEIAMIDSKDRKFRRLSEDEVSELVEELLIRKSKEEKEE